MGPKSLVNSYIWGPGKAYATLGVIKAACIRQLTQADRSARAPKLGSGQSKFEAPERHDSNGTNGARRRSGRIREMTPSVEEQISSYLRCVRLLVTSRPAFYAQEAPNGRRQNGADSCGQNIPPVWGRYDRLDWRPVPESRRSGRGGPHSMPPAHNITGQRFAFASHWPRRAG